MQPFAYPDLRSRPRSFRAIELLDPVRRSLPWPQDVVRIRLHTVDVDSGVPYDALSYSWDLTPRSRRNRPVIIVQGNSGNHGTNSSSSSSSNTSSSSGIKESEMLIFRPLEIALLHLSRNAAVKGNSNLRRLLFVDQICINQDDDAEKETQVRLMRDIYARCTRAIVWLGAPTAFSNAWFDAVHSVVQEDVLGRIMGPHVGRFIDIFDAVVDPSKPIVDDDNNLVRDDRDALLALLATHGPRFPVRSIPELFNRSWFRRLWIIQEACLSPDLLIVCGSRSLCYDCFRAGKLFYTIYNARWVGTHADDASRTEYQLRDAALDAQQIFTRIIQERKAIHRPGGRRKPLYDLLLKYNVNNGLPKVGATYPEDRFFGLLGLCEDIQPWDQIRVQYRDTVRTYTHLAALLCQSNIDILLFAQFPKKVSGLPTWVPDWSMELQTPRGYTTLDSSVYNASTVTPTSDSRAKSAGNSDVTIDIDSRRLSVRGFIVDHVVEVGSCEIVMDVESTTKAVKYQSVKRFCDEIGRFLDEAASSKSAAFTPPREKQGSRAVGDESSPSQTSQTDRNRVIMRLSDHGLTERSILGRPGAVAGSKNNTNLQQAQEQEQQQLLLDRVYGQVYKTGDKFEAADRQVESFRLSRILQTIGIVPWYWVPSSEVDGLRLCTTDPVAAAVIVGLGLRDFVIDILGVLCASTYVVLFAKYLRFRRLRRTIRSNDATAQAKYEGIGLDFSLARTPEMQAYLDNLVKTVDRRLYRTRSGFVGLGPRGMKQGDCLAVLHGSTMPHLLRVKTDVSSLLSSSKTQEVFTYIGEAYCDGVMDGEAVKARSEEAPWQTLNIY